MMTNKILDRTGHEKVNIDEIISLESISIFFQPIASLELNKIIGFEALVRGVNPDTNDYIQPIQLFELAREQGRTLALDQLCHRKAIEIFRTSIPNASDYLLFINVDNSYLRVNQTDVFLYNLLTDDLNTNNIVLEIRHVDVEDNELLVHFIKTYREKGFLISLDDIGVGYSNFDRLIKLKPDIIRIDIELIQNIETNYIQQQTVNVISMFAKNTGTIVIAKGIENIRQILTLSRFDIKLLQGFYIDIPNERVKIDFYEIQRKIETIAMQRNAFINGNLFKKRNNNVLLKSVFDSLNNKLEFVNLDSLEPQLDLIVQTFDQLEAAYIINMGGVQITKTCYNQSYTLLSSKLKFASTQKLADSSQKENYLAIRTSQSDMYISQEYISIVSQRKITTISGCIKINQGDYILCLDVLNDYLI